MSRLLTLLHSDSCLCQTQVIMAEEGDISALVCDNGSGMVKVRAESFSLASVIIVQTFMHYNCSDLTLLHCLRCRLDSPETMRLVPSFPASLAGHVIKE